MEGLCNDLKKENANEDKKYISIDDLKDWSNRVIFSPNATGKTRVTNALKLKLSHLNVQVFTSKSISDLVNTSTKDIYIGKSSKKQLENNNLNTKYDNPREFADLLNKYYGTTTATKLREESAIFGYFDFTNYRRLIEIFSRLKSYTSNNGKIDNYWEVDRLINSTLLKKIQKLKPPKSVDNMIKTIVPEIIIESFKNINEYIKLYKLYICPLCGHEYKSFDELREIVKDFISQYTSAEKSDLNNQINEVWIDFKKQYNKDSKLWNYLNNNDFLSISDRFTVLISYVELFDKVASSFLDDLIIIYPTITEDYSVYKDNTIIIDEEKTAILNKKEFQNDVIKRFLDLVPLPNNIIPVFNKKSELEVTIDGIKNKPYDVLSDSELKRLSLAVLFATIKYNDVDYLILDDPVDSYDDHNIVKASEYIGTFLTESSISWTIFSHFYESLFYILENVKIDSVDVFLRDPDYIYNPTHDRVPPIIYFSLPTDSFQTLRDNEIELLRKSLEVDNSNDLYMQKDFMMLSFLGTYRSIILSISNHFKKSTAYIAVKSKTRKIEASYLHYNEKTPLTLGDVEQLYKDWYDNISATGYFQNDYINSILQINDVRTDLLNIKGYRKILCNNPLLKAILFKILSVTESKYLIEKKLINEMKINGESAKSIKRIIEKCMLGNKISSAIVIDSTKYAKFSAIFNKYKNLINDYSHSAIRMVPPYLSMSVYELSQLVADVNSL